MKPLHRFFAALSLLVLPVLAHATLLTYNASMSGANEVPPNGSSATGFVTVTYDSSAHTLQVNLNFTGLTGGTAAAAHIHGSATAPPGTNAIVAIPFTGFPAATSGSYLNTFDLTLASSYNGAFVTANGGTVASAEAALASFLAGGTAYSNIHNAQFPGGEIRGNLAAAGVPDGSSTVLLFAPTLLILLRLARRLS